MKYGYAVKKNGILYTPGMEVPEDSLVKEEVSEETGEAFTEGEAELDKPKRAKKSKEE